MPMSASAHGSPVWAATGPANITPPASGAMSRLTRNPDSGSHGIPLWVMRTHWPGQRLDAKPYQRPILPYEAGARASPTAYRTDPDFGAANVLSNRGDGAAILTWRGRNSCEFTRVTSLEVGRAARPPITWPGPGAVEQVRPSSSHHHVGQQCRRSAGRRLGWRRNSGPRHRSALPVLSPSASWFDGAGPRRRTSPRLRRRMLRR